VIGAAARDLSDLACPDTLLKPPWPLTDSKAMRSLMIVAVLGVVALAGCGGATPNTQTAQDSAPAAEQPEKPRRAGPMACLRQADLMDPEKRDEDLWRGWDPVDGTIVLVERYNATSEAREGTAELGPVWARTAGRYSVHGAIKRSSGESTSSAFADGRHEANVDDVADCLRPH
jgi:uncharacterized lipoprotein NlpE involved in copper resistance